MLTCHSYLTNPDGRGIMALLATATRLQISPVRNFVYGHLTSKAAMGVTVSVCRGAGP